MSPTFWFHDRFDREERGQIIVIFAVAFAVIIMMLALLFDGARATVLRRQLQDASDASALAAANTFQGLTVKGCSATVGSPPGDPQPQVVAAAKASVQTNMPGYDLTKVAVTCVSGLNNNVQVVLSENSPSYFGSIFGGGGLTAATRSVAQNGYDKNNVFSVVLLDPSHYSWPNGQRGCPSFGVNGGIVAQFDSAVYVDSACDVAHGGAFAPNGGSATISFAPAYSMRITGEYNPGSLTVTPAPEVHQPPKPDPLVDLNDNPIPVGTMTIRSSSKLIINGTQTAVQCAAMGPGISGGLPTSPGCILPPGVYVGGIDLRSSAEVYLRPGIYVLQDGGLSLGAQSKLFSISRTATLATTATWDLIDCPDTSCGVLIYKTTVTSNDPISVTAGATFMVRAFNPDPTVDTTTYGVSYDATNLEHLLIWQYGPWANELTGPTASTQIQPRMQLQGGGNVVMSGAVYAPSAPVELHGTSGGSSGTGTVDLTIQFIVWDMSLSGNSNFHFRYSAEEFPKALDYGLVE
jgi:Flp pilus assembly protein TadG